MEQSKEEILFDKFHNQICNDCGLSESDSTEIAAKNCVIIAQQEAIGFQKWSFENVYQVANRKDVYYFNIGSKFYPSDHKPVDINELYAIFLNQQKQQS